MTIAEIFETMTYGPASESAAPALDWIAVHDSAFGLWIDGAWRAPTEGAWFETVNPATGLPLARIAQAGQADVDAAVQAARAALPGWQALGPHGRARARGATVRRAAGRL